MKFDRMQNVSIRHVCMYVYVHTYAEKVDVMYKRVIVPVLFFTRNHSSVDLYATRIHAREKKSAGEKTCKKFAIDLYRRRAIS